MWQEEMQRLREAGFSDEELAQYRAEQEQSLRDAGFSDEELSQHFGDAGQQTKEAAPSEPSFGQSLQAGLEGFGQIGGSGYLPEMQAFVEKNLMPNPTAEVDEQLRQQGMTIQDPSYKDMVAQNYARHAEQAKRSPVATNIGKGLGLVASGIALSPLMGARAAGLGRGALQGAKMGAAQGALYNPGQTEEGESSLQPMKRLGGAAIGGTVGGIAGGIGGLLQKASGRQADINIVKDPAKHAEYAKQQLSGAKQALWDKKSAPADQALRELLTGKSAKLQPEQLSSMRGISPEIDDMLTKLQPQQSGGLMGAQQAADVDANQLRDIRAMLGRESKFKPQAIYDAPAQAKVASAGRAQGIASDVLKGVDEGVGPLDEALSTSARLSKGIDRGMLRRPIETLQPKEGGSKEAALAAIDQMAGTNLRGRGQELKAAQKMLFKSPEEELARGILPLASKAARRGAVKAGSMLDQATPAGSNEALIKALMELKRE